MSKNTDNNFEEDVHNLITKLCNDFETKLLKLIEKNNKRLVKEALQTQTTSKKNDNSVKNTDNKNTKKKPNKRKEDSESDEYSD